MGVGGKGKLHKESHVLGKNQHIATQIGFGLAFTAAFTVRVNVIFK